jgi:hypothetical protein
VAVITIAGETISGIWEAPRVARPRIQVTRSKFFGVLGESEIHGRGGGREIEIPIYMFDHYASAQAVMDRIAQLEAQASLGLHGTLTMSGAVPRTYQDVTFEGFEEDPAIGILEDVAGTLDGGWFVKGTLYFYDLRTG